MTRHRTKLLLLGALLTLAGCDSGVKLGADFNAPFATEATTPAAASAAADPKAAAPAAPETTAAVPPRLTKFHNMSAPEVEALVGEPDFRRVEPPAELWQYRTPQCVVDLYLYGQGDAMHVVHEDARGRNPAATGDACGDGAQVLRNHRPAG
ncbi:MAG TPA: hypothetical protein VIJ42_02265 [Stellaceae bacterium]